MGVGVAEKFTDQERGWIEAGFLGEALGEGEKISFGEVEFHALDAVHGKEDDAGSEGIAILDLHGEVIKGGDVDAAQAETFGRKLENRTPEFFARVR